MFYILKTWPLLDWEAVILDNSWLGLLNNYQSLSFKHDIYNACLSFTNLNKLLKTFTKLHEPSQTITNLHKPLRTLRKLCEPSHNFTFTNNQKP